MKTCLICGKSDLKHQGALNIHMYHCKVKNGQVKEVKEHFENNKQDCEVTGNHSWRLLGNTGIERNARQAGFMEVCSHCQSVQ
jgi:hypothetical protein